MTARKFYAKVLLFGEYSLLAGSKAITIPWTGFSGQLRYTHDLPGSKQHAAERSNTTLQQFASFLAGDAPCAAKEAPQTTSKGIDLPAAIQGDDQPSIIGAEGHHIVNYLDVRQYVNDLDKGLCFESDIPVGYGLGSSGALVAAVFDRYTTLGVKPEQAMPPYLMRLLKQLLAAMENYFHTTSSGIDPLSCYLGRPLQVQHGEAAAVDLPGFPSGFPGGFFLLDTKQPRQTGPLVAGFREKNRQMWFHDYMRNVYCPTVDAAVEVLLEGDMEGMAEIMHMLSHHQLMYFKEMIPAGFLSLWEKGITTNEFSLKLCGAGGGGYLLGFTKDYAAAEEALMPHQPIRIEPYTFNP